jgi:hypothetical protein
MSILWVRCLALQVFRTCSQWWIGRLAGRKQFRSLLPPPPTAQRPSSKVGSSVSASQVSSQATEVHSLHHHFGPLFVLSSPSSIHRPQPITLNPTASWNVSTAE